MEMSLNNAIKSIERAKDLLSQVICDKLKGNCEKCPFKTECIVEKMVDIQLDVEGVKYDLKEILRK